MMTQWQNSSGAEPAEGRLWWDRSLLVPLAPQIPSDAREVVLGTGWK